MYEMLRKYDFWGPVLYRVENEPLPAQMGHFDSLRE
jgi:hypothetical protein